MRNFTLLCTVVLVVFVTLIILRGLSGSEQFSLGLAIVIASLIVVFRQLKRQPLSERLLVITFIISVLLFAIGNLDGIQYNQIASVNEMDIKEGVDPAIGFYERFSSSYALSFYCFLILAIASLCTIWIKGTKLPPIVFVLLWALIVIGICLNVAITMHIGLTTFVSVYDLIALILFLRNTLTVAELAQHRTYKNKVLNFFNNLAAKAFLIPIWVLIFTAPLILIIILILMLLGQDSHAMIKVFTETATWHFSEKPHPPIKVIPHTGHYLCTVAARGNPEIVKPIGYGIRHGHPILVNRQLQVANAFEELIQDAAPRFHRFIRNAYDKYGYPLSEKIDTPRMSNLTYILMKPLEWFFLIILYTFCIKPEEKIARQYS